MATFLQESVQPGCSKPVWLVRTPTHRKVLVSVGSFELSERAAWEKYLKEIEGAMPGLYDQLSKAERAIGHANAEVERITVILRAYHASTSDQGDVG